jgi:undecaprenyl-diphosphatase
MTPLDYINIVPALILGLIQGLTEFLPISSSAHLRIAGLVMPGAEDPGATFTAITQIGTELAVLLYFRKDIANIIRSWFLSVFSRRRGAGRFLTPEQRVQARLGWFIIGGTIPIAVLGLMFQDTIRETFRSLWLIGAVLVIFGIILWIADKAGRTGRVLADMKLSQGVAIGLAQALALIPGVSRSGATISMARALGFNRAAAARFAFLLAIPAVLASGLYETYSAIKDQISGEGAIPAIPFTWYEIGAATAVAFVVGLAIIAFLMNYLKKHSFLPFVIYRILLGGTILVLLTMGVIQP